MSALLARVVRALEALDDGELDLVSEILEDLAHELKELAA